MTKKALLSVLCIVIVALATISFIQSRFIVTATNSSSDLVSDGIDNVQQPSIISLNRILSLEETCKQTYGFLPCTTTVFENLFLIVVYGFLMYQAATLLFNGSELLLEILGPGLIGGLFLPILGALPDAMLIRLIN